MTPQMQHAPASGARRTLVRGGLFFIAAHTIFVGVALALAVGG